MTAIAATTGTIRSRVDGTLVMTIEFEPGQAQDAFRLFAAPGTQVAIAALMDGSFLEQKPDKPEAGIPASDKSPRAQMGDACYRTVLWCQEPKFWDFLNSNAQFSSNDMVTDKEEAADAVRFICCVESRKELDTNNEANKTWHRLIREPYSRYLRNLKEPA